MNRTPGNGPLLGCWRHGLLAIVFGLRAARGARAAFRLATVRVDVTCPIGHPLLGRRQGIARTIADPLSAHGFVLLGAGPPIAFVAVDWCEIRNDAYDQWRELLAAAAGTSRERVILCAVHQHDAPLADLGAEKRLAEVGLAGESLDVTFFKRTGQRIADGLRDSLPRAQRITHLGIGQARVQSIASNRRVALGNGTVTFRRGSNGGGDRINREAEDGLIDPWLKTISFWDGDRPVAAVNAYAVHPMSYYGRGDVSADFVGMARQRHAFDTAPAFQIYVSGCSGDVTAGKYNDGSPANRPVLADRLHQAMRSAWKSTRRQPLKRIRFRTTALDLEFRKDVEFSKQSMRRVLEDRNASRKARVLAAMGLSTRHYLDSGHSIEMPCIDFGSAQMVLFPGESFVGYQLLAQKLRPRSFVMSIGFGQCWTGYLPTQTAFADGFDGFWLWVAPGAEPRIQQGLLRVLGSDSRP
ncbi:MAG: hypothetical protein ABGZ17_20035 [Planctomycetaceae bacterium]